MNVSCAIGAIRRSRRALRRAPGVALVATALAVAGVTAACGRTASTGDSAAAADEYISWTHFDPPVPPAATPAMLARGEEVYRDNCASCHGPTGAADGICSQFLLPQPRNFTTGVFRFKTTPGGEMPTDQDLFRTVSLGLHGTGMPPWKFLLSEEDRWAVVHHVKRLSAKFDETQVPTPVDLGSEPETITPERVANGKRLYAVAQCAKCHGEGGYGDGPSATELIDSFNQPIAPRNFHKIGQFKRGYTVRDIALTIHTGNNGTPMPAFDTAFKPDEIWDLAAYVHTLGERRLSGGGERAAADVGRELGTPDVVVQLMERSWKYVPNEIHVTEGQIVRIEFQPSDNGLGAGHGFAVDGYDQDVFINGAMVQRPKSVTFKATKAGRFTFYCASQCSTGDLHPQMKGVLVVERSTAAGE